MADSPTSDELIRRLAGEFRVLTLGGIAVISHGFSRNTFDADIWVDPMDSAEKWAARIAPFVYSGDTGRDKDLLDIAFLENKAEKEYLEKLTEATEEDATRMLARFLTPRVAEAALHHPAAAVVKLALRYLREMAEEGNPFAGDILKQRE